MTLGRGRCPSPLGPIELLVAETGAVVQVRFALGDYSRSPGARSLRDDARDDGRRTAESCRQLTEYFAGRCRRFGLALALRGSPFQLEVWRAMLEIPYGEVRTYAEIATAVGRPHGARAVGRASALNRLPILVPCHRLLGRDGGLRGYAGGLDLKRRLLEIESVGRPA